MATNKYFSNQEYTPEQDLLSDLVVESIQQYGVDCFYLPRTIVNENNILNEGETESFNNSYMLDFYIKSFDSFAGEGSFLTAYGIEIRDELTLTVANRTFNQSVTQFEIGIPRPLEGDLIYIPMIKAVYQIKKAEKAITFYQMGGLQSYDLICQLYEYSSEVFNTGIAEIDDIYNAFSTTANDYLLTTELLEGLNTENSEEIIIETYDINAVDNTADNKFFEIQGQTIIDFTDKNPFSAEIY